MAQLGFAYPAAQQVGVDAVGHRHCSHRHAWQHARGDGSGFEFVAVRSTAPAWADGLFRSSAHVSTKKLKVDTSVLCAYRRFKMGWLAAYRSSTVNAPFAVHQ